MRHARASRGWRGFSLVEMLVVVAIVSVLASIALPLADLAHRRNREAQLRQALRELRTALDQYKRLVDQGNIARPAGGSGYPPNLEVLVEGVQDARSPAQVRIYLLRRLPRDPFASDTLEAAQTWGLRSYQSPPDDPRPGEDVFDVYSKATGTGLDGTPLRSW